MKRNPDIRGKGGVAWRASYETHAGRPAVIRTLLIHQSHDFTPWHHYVISSCHLRDIPGMSAPHRQFPEARWEVLVRALNPECQPPDMDRTLGTTENPLHLLTPADVVLHLWHPSLTDTLVASLTDFLAFTMCGGMLSDGPGSKRLFQLGTRHWLTRHAHLVDSGDLLVGVA